MRRTTPVRAAMAMALVFAIVALTAQSANAQRVAKKEYTGAQLNSNAFQTISWTTTTMNSKFDPKEGDNLKSTKIIAKYKPEVDKLDLPIGHCPIGLSKSYPDSPLSNWAADALLEFARGYWNNLHGNDNDGAIDFSMINFGGIRTDMPKGKVTKNHILSMFPFNNYLVFIEMRGENVEKLMNHFALTRAQAMGNVKLIIENKAVKECLIGGKPIERNGTYRLATIDFLLDGGDGLYTLKQNKGVTKTDIKVMELMISYIEGLTAAGKQIKGSKDGRTVIVK